MNTAFKDILFLITKQKLHEVDFKIMVGLVWIDLNDIHI